MTPLAGGFPRSINHRCAIGIRYGRHLCRQDPRALLCRNREWLIALQVEIATNDVFVGGGKWWFKMIFERKKMNKEYQPTQQLTSISPSFFGVLPLLLVDSNWWPCHSGIYSDDIVKICVNSAFFCCFLKNVSIFNHSQRRIHWNRTFHIKFSARKNSCRAVF